ncbi:hypothetical protein [Veronia nyctiphanis]|uniref:hypothetical protein n=1 Tax=Veronia nyctiphanis TaxID=1278244 RepID=UPI00100B925B|nr:hypothetical protein [Veronia nyctiphanis]
MAAKIRRLKAVDNSASSYDNEPPQLSPEGWKAELELDFHDRGDKTILKRYHHRGPLAVQRPLYPEATFAIYICSIPRVVWSVVIS